MKKVKTIDLTPDLNGYKKILAILEKLKRPNKVQVQTIKEIRAYIKGQEEKAKNER